MGGIVLFSDSHFANRSSFGRMETNSDFPGCNSRFNVIAKAFMNAVKYAETNHCESIFILGDVFHDRGVIDVPVYNGVYQLFKEATGRGIKVIIYPGNHDMVDLRAMHAEKHLHSLFAFDKLAFVFDKPSVIQTAYFPVAVIPFSTNKTVVEAAENLLFKMSGDIKMLMLHHSINGATTGPHEWVMPHKIDVDELPSGYTHMWSGHYHRHQQLVSTDNTKRLWYVGAPVHHDFGERNYIPGFIHVHPDGKWQHIENTESPRFKVIVANDERDIEEAIKSNNYVSIKWKGNVKQVDDIKNRLPKNCIIEVMRTGTMPLARTDIHTTDQIETMIEKYASAKVNDPSDIINHGMLLYKGHK